jgi:hypothetical protein
MPPISPHEFELALSPCHSWCMFSLLHDCIEPPTGDFALKRIPKRNGALELHIGVTEFAWGLQAQYAISVMRIGFYHLLILAGPFGFWAWWQVIYPDDLQNAVVPFTAVAVCLSLFWSSAGILKVFREPA